MQDKYFDTVFSFTLNTYRHHMYLFVQDNKVHTFLVAEVFTQTVDRNVYQKDVEI